MERWIKRTALVTGASSGIGAAVTRKLVASGMNVAGCGRNVQRIQELAEELKDQPGSLLAIKCDLNKEDEILSMFETIKSHYGGIDVCINNAGLAHNAPLLSGRTDHWQEMLNVNVLALSICTREAVKSMKEHNVNDGHIIHVNSMSGHRVVNSPHGHFYSATKFAVTGLINGLRNELRQLNSEIRITSISPGMVDTDFQYRLHKDEPEKVKKMFTDRKVLESDDVANAIMFALQAPKHCEINDVLMRPTTQIY